MWKRCTSYKYSATSEIRTHFGSRAFVLYMEAVLWWEVRIVIVISIGAIACVLYIEVVLWWEGPL